VLKEELGVPVVCELSGEDIFLDALAPRDREDAGRVIRERAADVDRFVATSHDYAGRMAAYLGVPAADIDVVYPSVSTEYIAAQPHRASGTPTVGYLARICPEKGLHRLVDAMLLLWQTPGMANVELRVGGYVGKGYVKWYEQQQARVRSAGKSANASFHGTLDRGGKLALLDACDVLSVPTEYAEAKGIPILEAWSRGVPVVQPAHGSFPELIEKSGGAGVLVPPGDAKALADAIASLLRNPDERQRLGQLGREAARTHFTDEHMADGMLGVFETLVRGKRQPAMVGA
jgi:glycosyltransferase involved in cell wall biosynthesis